jgi:hypothetical protein
MDVMQSADHLVKSVRLTGNFSFVRVATVIEKAGGAALHDVIPLKI